MTECIASARPLPNRGDFSSLQEFATAIDKHELIQSDEDFRDYFNLPDRCFFHLCKKEARANNPSLRKENWDRYVRENGPFYKVLGRTERTDLWSYVQAHLLLCRKAEWTNVRDEMLQRIKKETKLPVGFLRLLAEEMYGESVQLESSLTMPVLLVQNEGYMVNLTMMLVANGECERYPAPASSMMKVDTTFLNGLDAAIKFVTAKETLDWKLNNRDICWELSPRGSEWPPEVKGPSASAAMAMLLAKLLAPKHGP